MGSSSSAPSKSTAITKQSTAERQKVLHCQIKEGNKKDFYEIFNFERYSSPSTEQVDRAFRQESRKYHPDKNPLELKSECDGIMSVLGLAKETLTDHEKKRRYDIELRAARSEQTGWDTFAWLAKVSVSVVSAVGGAALIITGLCGLAPFAAGFAGVAGTTTLAAGLASGQAIWRDPSLSGDDFAKSWLVGGVQGAVTGGIAVAAAPVVATASAGTAVAVMAASGAACGVAQKGIQDVASVLEGTKSAAECFTKVNAISYGRNAVVGAVLGAAVGAANHSFKAASLSDEATVIATRLAKRVTDFSSTALESLKQLAREVGIDQYAALRALEAARGVCALSALSILSSFHGLRGEDRWLCQPTSSASRAPKYLEFACGRLEQIHATVIQDAASQDKVLRPLHPKNCLHAYTAETALYRNVNGSLRLDSDMGEYGAFVWHTKAAIQKEISKHGRYTGTVWRGVKLSKDQLSFYTEGQGQKFLWADFVSSSTSKEVAASFGGNAIFEILCEAKSFTDCVDIHSKSVFPSENEVLFSPYSGFEVVGVDREESVPVIHLRTCETLLVEVELARDQTTSFVGDSQVLRGENRWLCPLAVHAGRQPKYLEFTCGREVPSSGGGAPPLLPDDCLRAYTNGVTLCRDINAALAKDTKMDSYGGIVWQLKAAIKKEISKRGLYQGIAWRGANLSEEHLSQYTRGRRFLWANLVSTSISRDTAVGFGGNTLFKINCKGNGLTYCVDVSPCSAFPDEQEVLFFPYSGFEVMDVNQEGSRHVIHLQTYDTILVEQESARKDRWLCHPATRLGRRPKYLEFTRGSMQEVHPTVVLQDVASSDDEVVPIPAEDCLAVYMDDATLHHHVNAALSTDTMMEEYGAFIWQLKAAIKREISKRGLFPGIVWRGATLSQEDLLSYVPGRKFLWADFVSTSISRDVAVSFGGNALFKINCKGEGLTYCVDVSSCSAFPDEQEVLFFPYSGFEVMDVKWEDWGHVIRLQTCDTILVEEHCAHCQ